MGDPAASAESATLLVDTSIPSALAGGLQGEELVHDPLSRQHEGHCGEVVGCKDQGSSEAFVLCPGHYWSVLVVYYVNFELRQNATENVRAQFLRYFPFATPAVVFASPDHCYRLLYNGLLSGVLCTVCGTVLLFS